MTAKKSLVIRHDILIQAGCTITEETPQPRAEVVRWDSEVKFESDGTNPLALQETRINFSRFAGLHVVQLTVEADLVSKDASGKAQIAVALDDFGDDSTPPSNFFAQAETESDKWVGVSASVQIPVPTITPNSRTLVRLVGIGSGSVKNVTLTVEPASDTPAPASAPAPAPASGS